MVSELWVQGAFPSKVSEDSLASLAAEGLFPTDLCQYLDNLKTANRFPATRPLFAHQAEAFRKAVAARSRLEANSSLVITAGTGAGKTEAFLLPILSGLWKQPRSDNETGTRCLILYPMNALVTDQVTRLYGLLEEQTTLSLFHFTSETPEKDRNVKAEERWKSCRRRSRDAARANIPDIVITNYSMLEYMLCRPQDQGFFGPALRYIVLDEAHLYTGTLAAEITLLLRRVRDRCRVTAEQLTHIATSATLGGTEEDLRSFAATVFSVPSTLTDVIKGENAPLPQTRTLQSAPMSDANQLAEYAGIEIVTLTADGGFAEPDENALSRLQQLMLNLLPEDIVSAAAAFASRILAPFLAHSLEQVPMVRRLAELIYENELQSIDELTRRLWGEGKTAHREATILLLRLTAAARFQPNESPLVPHRLHFLVRAPQGLAACLNTKCSGPVHLLSQGCGCLQAPRDRCVYCNAITLPVYRCKACGQWALAGHENTETGELEAGYFTEVAKRRYYLVTETGGKDLSVIVVNPETGEYSGKGSGTRLFRAPCPEHGASCDNTSQCTQQVCPHCEISWTSRNDEDDDDWDLQIQPLRGAERLALAVAAETVLYGMPMYADGSRNWKPGNGRRLLCFSDSRREAARLGPLLSAQHETWVIRSVIANTLANHKSPPSTYLNRKIREYEGDAADLTLPQLYRDDAKRKIADFRNQLTNANSGIPFTDFARFFADDPRISELLDRELAEKHGEWRQEHWKDNRKSVAAHAEALIAQELDNPLRTAVSTEAVGILELVYPGLADLPVPPAFAGRYLNEELRSKLAVAWPDFLAALLDTLRADRVVAWSKEEAGRKWNEESPLYGRWSTRSKNGWTARRFIGDDSRPKLQLRLWFAQTVLRAIDSRESLATPLLGAAFDDLFDAAGQKKFPWLISERHEVNRDESDQAIQILLDRLWLRKPEKLYRCPDTGTLWPRTILGWAPLRGCLGHLQEINHNEADDDRRWRRARLELVSLQSSPWDFGARSILPNLARRRTSAGNFCFGMALGISCHRQPLWNSVSISAD